MIALQKYENKLKMLRKEKNVKINDILDYANISLSYYYQLERGEKRLNEDALNLLADFYKVSTDYILGRTEGEKDIVLEGDSLPTELRGYVDAISAARKEFTPEELEKIIEAAKMIRGLNK